MYTVSVEDTGNHPDSVISEIRKCLISCLKTDPASMEELRQRLTSQLSQPAVMGGLYRCIMTAYSFLDNSDHHAQVYVG